ncbi:MAG: T9SS type A sorting domain-containing protein, partial [Bacteroidales bacterium]|nr:T9SS type A sorting domain-containing protein [Bacteroidales bacterium]
PINEVYQMGYSTLSATFDGPGTCVTSPNIWYDFTATRDGDLVITTNGSSYDTKITLYNSFDCSTMTEIGCDDDGGAGVNSLIRLLGITTGDEFKIEVGGSYSNKGNGLLTVEVFTCPSGGIAENEPCGDNFNGGCFMSTPAFEQINDGDIICGTLWAENGQRDMDWFELTIADYATVTMNVYGTGPMVFGPAEQYQPGCAGCDYITGLIEPATTIDVLEQGSLTTGPLPPGTYYFIIQPNLFSGYPCDTLKYIAEWTVSPYTPSPGEFCSNAIIANMGINNASQQQAWFAFPGNGNDIRITSCIPGQNINTDLYVYDGCCGNFIVANDDDPGCGDNQTASLVEFLAEAGITYYLHWDSTYSTEAFSFNIIDLSAPQNLWTGNSSTDWSANGNWSNSSPPNGGISALIPSVPTGGIFPETNSGSGVECFDLTIETGAHLYIPPTNTMTVYGTLINNAGVDGLQIQAALDGIGSLIHNSVGVEATCEEYLISEQWHYVSSPISNATANTYFGIYLKKYNEPDNNWTYIVEPTTPLNASQGYAAWASDGFTGSTKVSFAGELIVNDYSIPSLSYTPASEKTGFNLIGNPYASSVDWNNNWQATDVGGAAYFYNGSQYVDWNRITGVGTATNGNIPPTQGFFILATSASASITIPKSERIHGTQPFYKETETFDNLITLETNGNGYSDKIIITFAEEATNDFDNDYDAYDMKGIQESPQLYSIMQDIDYSVNVLSSLTSDMIIPLGIEVGVPEIYTISVAELINIDNDVEVVLEDIKENTFIELSANTTYQFTADPLDDHHRFNLHFKNSNFGIDEEDNKGIHIYSYNDIIYIQTREIQDAEIAIFNITGQGIIRERINGGLSRIKISNGTGYYIVKVQTDEFITIKKVFIR